LNFITTQFNLIRETYAPDIDSDQFPPAQHVQSIHNMPIEGLWHWFVTLFGVDIKDAILEGKVTGIYNPGNPIHPYVILLITPHLKIDTTNTQTTIQLDLATDPPTSA